MLLGLPLVALALAAPPAPATWLDHLLPRPREVRLEGERAVAPAQVRVVRAAGPRAAAAAELLATVLGEPSAVATGPRLVLALADPLPAELTGLLGEAVPDRPQASAIRPLPDGGLALVGRDEAGLRSAARTLLQLLAARRTTDQVVIPKLTATDWPALEERGFWGGDAAQDLPWLAARKVNLVEVHAKLGFAADGTPTATLKPELLEQADRLGIQIVPIIHHLEQLQDTGLFQRHPELDGGPPPSKNPNQRLLKMDHPNLPGLLTAWFAALGRYPQVSAVTVWLSEEGTGPTLADATQNPFVYEAKLVENAFQKAREQCSRLRLRLLTTQATFQHNEAILAVLRPDTAVIHYDGSRTYNSSRQPLMPPYFQPWAAAGHWLGVCPILTADWRGVAPWHGAEFIQERMRNFLASGVRTLVGYATPSRRFYEFNLEAAAQYAWNPEAMTPREFARAYAVRRGVKDPAAFADWAELTGPVGQDLYGSRVIVTWCYGSSVPAAAKGGLKLGTGIFAEFADEARLAADQAAMVKARALAAKLGEPQLDRETAALASWVDLMATYWKLNGLLPGAKDLIGEARAPVGQTLADFDRHAAATAAALTAWGEGVLATGERPPGRWEDTIRAIQDEATGMAALGETLGYPDQRKPYRRAKVGAWQTADFDQQGTITATYDVTDRIGGAGRYEVEFAYTSGLLGLGVSKVVLVAQQGDDPATRRELAADEHRCHAGAWNDRNLYHLDLREPAAGARYLVLATMSAGSPQQPALQRSSNGEVYCRKVEAP